MNNKFIILSLLLALAASQTYSITSCTCAQLLSEGDCIKNISLGCSWDSAKKACAVSTTPVTPTVSYAAYCDTFAETDCPKAKPCTDCGIYAACAWVESKCTFFTGCTPFAKTTDNDCQAISNRCITDGTHCVEVDACSTYKKQLPCVKNAAGSLCYWDTTNNTCVDANTCDKLPTTFATDKNCRDSISTCTTKTGGGCVDSGNNCSDQLLEIQCVWNKLKTTSCYWDGAACKDRICDNAPTSLNTDETCKTFRTDGTCTTKANGGCVTRTTCAAATIQASCIKNSSGGDCYWTGTACVDKTCANAPTTMTTNSACAGFVTGCITKTGGGCVANGACSVATIQAACVKNSTGFDCIWDTTCKEKTCANAPITNTTHDLCTSYLSSCTLKSGGGCQPRTCANAPITLTTNDACESYLTGNSCITKSGGGCVTNTTCAAITLEAACVKNVTGSTCFWDTASSSCKDKTCVNAPSTNTTHDLCQTFLNTCTVNSTSAGCVEKTCENSLALAICDKDTSNRACIWKGKCYKKQCVLASSATTTHADCQTYHSSCTLSNTGAGCVVLPLKCEAITLEAACQIKSNGQPCGWNGSQCIDKACSTASKTFTTTTQCQGHISSCVANNPATVNGSLTIQGCQDLPTTCAARKSNENCEISRQGFPTCLWVSSSSTCVEKSCATASTVGTTGALSAGGFTFSACQTYLNSCISNNTSDGCMAKPSSCTQLVSSNCQLQSKASGDCYWNGTGCVDRTCANIILTTHNSCFNSFSQCTVNNGGTACQPLATACTSYTTQENCKISSTNKNCIWTGLACRSATCADAPDTASYDTDGECYNYPTPSETCTVVYKVGAQGCVPRAASCSDYMTQAQCHKTLANLTANDDCKWVVDKCYALSSFSTGACTTFKGTQTMCQGYRAGCTNVVGATSSTSCTLDCTLKTGVNLTFQDCQALDATKCRAYFSNKCTVAETGQGCVDIPTTCETMTQKQCYYNKAGNPCYWTGTACITKSCDNAPDATASADDCNTYLAGCTLDNVKCKTKVCEDFAFATDALCKQAITSCTTNGANCVTRGTCFQALSQAGCVTSSTNQQCEWIPAVMNAQNIVTSPAYCTIKNCSTAPVTLTSEAACAGYFTNCTTKNGGGCVAKSTCAAVTIDVACTTALNGTVCAWDSAQNKCRDKDCQDFSGSTHAACQAQRAGCTAGLNGKCAKVQNCEQTAVRAACIEGSNGPCLWVDKYLNTDGTKGACFRYTSCKSLSWNSDASCKWISNRCTTNGSTCVGITLCQETNTDGGCVTGYDGACIQSVPALNSPDPKVCKPYTSCADAFYTTHSDCQIASSKCTTNGTTGCIALGSCSSYTSQAGCHFNDKGAILTSGAITSTGICTWDTTASSCRDQSCADLTGTAHSTCASQLSTCTSDGTTCLLKGACSSYTTQTACTTAVGSDGICYWELASATNNNTAKCRLLTCADIQNGTATNVCAVALSSCVSNGTVCISKANCSTYTTKTACNSGGLDGICVFTQSTATGAAVGTGTCALMTACTVANNDQTACQSARDRCAWTAASGTGATAVASKCTTHTCATNQATNGSCSRFLNWDKKTQQICTLVSGACTATDPSTLTSNDCFLVSGYTYTWNASTSKCGVCTAVVVQPNNSNNNTTDPGNETNTDSGYILGLSTIIFGLIFQ